MTKLADILKPTEDQALFFPLGAAGGIRVLHVYRVGLPYEPPWQPKRRGELASSQRAVRSAAESRGPFALLETPAGKAVSSCGSA